MSAGSKNLLKISLITVAIVLTLRIFLFASFRIPTVSMLPTILPGDFILVNKLIPGPRMDWLHLFKNDQYVRLKGYRSVRRGDIIVFNPPYHEADTIQKNPDIYYVKRCYGIPGDSVYLDQYGRFSLKTMSPKNSTAKEQMIYIPKKDEEIFLDTTNIIHYKNIIAYETKGKLTYDKGITTDKSYRFRQDYYLVVGDNSSNSDDSRFWGLLPEDHIVGKAKYIWKSIDYETGKYRFNRFFTSLN